MRNWAGCWTKHCDTMNTVWKSRSYWTIIDSIIPCWRSVFDRSEGWILLLKGVVTSPHTCAMVVTMTYNYHWRQFVAHTALTNILGLYITADADSAISAINELCESSFSFQNFLATFCVLVVSMLILMTHFEASRLLDQWPNLIAVWSLSYIQWLRRHCNVLCLCWIPLTHLCCSTHGVLRRCRTFLLHMCMESQFRYSELLDVCTAVCRRATICPLSTEL